MSIGGWRSPDTPASRQPTGDDRPIKVWGGVTQEQLDDITKDVSTIESLIPAVLKSLQWQKQITIQKEWHTWEEERAKAGSSSSGSRRPCRGTVVAHGVTFEDVNLDDF